MFKRTKQRTKRQQVYSARALIASSQQSERTPAPPRQRLRCVETFTRAHFYFERPTLRALHEKNFICDQYYFVMEKEHQPDSMATITMKPEYPPSEVYSASEPPPVWIYPLLALNNVRHVTNTDLLTAACFLNTIIQRHDNLEFKKKFSYRLGWRIKVRDIVSP